MIMSYCQDQLVCNKAVLNRAVEINQAITLVLFNYGLRLVSLIGKQLVWFWFYDTHAIENRSKMF